MKTISSGSYIYKGEQAGLGKFVSEEELVECMLVG